MVEDNSVIAPQALQQAQWNNEGQMPGPSTQSDASQNYDGIYYGS